MSFQNLYLYNSILPSYDTQKTEKEDNAIDADDPTNKEQINNLINQMNNG